MNFKIQKPMNKRMNGMKLKWERLKCKFLSDQQEILVKLMQPTWWFGWMEWKILV